MWNQSFSTILSLFGYDGPAFRNAIVSPDIPSSVLALHESAGRGNAWKAVKNLIVFLEKSIEQFIFIQSLRH